MNRSEAQIYRFIAPLVLSLAIWPAVSQPALVGMGDSIGEGVQAGDAAWQTQVFSYLSWVNFQMGAESSLPLFQTGLLSVVGDTGSRSRIFPETVNNNIAVSGATLHSLLFSSADASNPGEIDTELDMVIYPRQQTQIEYAESSIPEVIICWIGNNDVLSAATSFSSLDASQLTPVSQFDAEYILLADRLSALATNHGTRVVFANIPDVTDIGFLMGRAQAEQLTGFPVNLPEGHFTSVIGVLLMRIFGNDGLIADPNMVLDPNEVALVQQRTKIFNAIIQREANRIGMPVVDINGKFRDLVSNPATFLGIPLTNAMFGGLFSLDGVHPSNITHALLANEFITTMNQSFNMNVPVISEDVLDFLFLFDPSIDKDKDGKSTGRLGVGLIETLAFLFGFTGDSNDFIAD